MPHAKPPLCEQKDVQPQDLENFLRISKIKFDNDEKIHILKTMSMINSIFDDNGYSDKGGRDEGWGDTYRWDKPKYGRAYPRAAQYAGQVFTGRDGRVWERYLNNKGELKVRPHKAVSA